MHHSFLLSIFILVSSSTFAQKDTAVFELGMEFRPRFEFRDGYRQLPSDSLGPAYFVSSRTRLNLDYETKKAAFHMSFQDVRIWGQNGNNPATGSLGVFEAYAKLKVRQHWWLKLGRQAVELDNGRLFSKANWNQFSRAHDGMRFTFKNTKWQNEFMLFYNQNTSGNFGNSYPLNFYKYLLNHYLVYSPTEQLTFNVLNSYEGYQSIQSTGTIYARGTSGGRVTWENKKWSATVATYYQYGQLRSGQNVSAYYIQPELGVHLKPLKIRLGAEYLSGDDNLALSTTSHSFSTLYGVAFKFMGHLNYFTNFPGDVNGGGLINPYLFFDLELTKKFRLKIESHLFYTQNNVLDLSGEPVDPYLGAETDLKLKYNFSPELFLDFGFSVMAATKSMETLKTGSANKIPVFSFLMLTWKPQLLESIQVK